MSILNTIIKHKELEVKKQKQFLSEDKLIKLVMLQADKKRSLYKALHNTKCSIIAEFKLSSPSSGDIVVNKDMRLQLLAYQAGGAKAVSILTDKDFFSGNLTRLFKAKHTVDLPILRKDFIIDPYQLYESKLYMADAVLLIVSVLNKQKINQLTKIAKQLDLDILYEVHDEADIEKVLPLKPKLIGINARNLKTMQVDINHVIELAKKIPANIKIVAESGIKTKTDINKLKKHGINNFLIGTSLMQSHNSLKLLKQLCK